jgi:hypothetical protein
VRVPGTWGPTKARKGRLRFTRHAGDCGVRPGILRISTDEQTGTFSPRQSNTMRIKERCRKYRLEANLPWSGAVNSER